MFLEVTQLPWLEELNPVENWILDTRVCHEHRTSSFFHWKSTHANIHRRITALQLCLLLFSIAVQKYCRTYLVKSWLGLSFASTLPQSWPWVQPLAHAFTLVLALHLSSPSTTCCSLTSPLTCNSGSSEYSCYDFLSGARRQKSDDEIVSHPRSTFITPWSYTFQSYNVQIYSLITNVHKTVSTAHLTFTPVNLCQRRVDNFSAYLSKKQRDCKSKHHPHWLQTSQHSLHQR